MLPLHHHGSISMRLLFPTPTIGIKGACWNNRRWYDLLTFVLYLFVTTSGKAFDWSMVGSLYHRSFFNGNDITLNVCGINQSNNQQYRTHTVDTVQHISSPRALWWRGYGVSVVFGWLRVTKIWSRFRLMFGLRSGAPPWWDRSVDLRSIRLTPQARSASLRLRLIIYLTAVFSSRKDSTLKVPNYQPKNK